mgnify:CR=1 FL=1
MENILRRDGITDTGSNARIGTNKMGCSHWTIEREREREKEREDILTSFRRPRLHLKCSLVFENNKPK